MIVAHVSIKNSFKLERHMKLISVGFASRMRQYLEKKFGPRFKERYILYSNGDFYVTK